MRRGGVAIEFSIKKDIYDEVMRCKRELPRSRFLEIRKA